MTASDVFVSKTAKISIFPNLPIHSQLYGNVPLRLHLVPGDRVMINFDATRHGAPEKRVKGLLRQLAADALPSKEMLCCTRFSDSEPGRAELLIELE